MANIVPKLNLNKTPNLVENNSLIFAKNIRLDVDETIHRDYSIASIIDCPDLKNHYLKEPQGLATRIYNDVKNDFHHVAIPINHPFYAITKFSEQDRHQYGAQYKIIGTISDSTDFYIFLYGVNYLDTGLNKPKELSLIVRYNEKTKLFSLINCNWNWSKGSITGTVQKTLYGDILLIIGEYFDEENKETLIPLKTINITNSSCFDDESIYAQTPIIPLTNLNLINTFDYVIPNGVYQFFVRYKIKDNFYTNWFPASKDCFAGNRNSESTIFGTIRYCNIKNDSSYSFVFNIKHGKNNIYKTFQIGFILSNNDSIIARTWKHFDINADTIYFDYKKEDAEEIDVIDFLKPTFNVYNVKNITNFKNKLYISNYKETNFNKNLQNYANDISIEFKDKDFEQTYNNYKIKTENKPDNYTYITGLVIDNKDVLFSGSKSIIHNAFYKSNGITNPNKSTIHDLLKGFIEAETIEDSELQGHGVFDIYGFNFSVLSQSLKQHYDKNSHKDEYKLSDSEGNLSKPNEIRIEFGVNDLHANGLKKSIILRPNNSELSIENVERLLFESIKGILIINSSKAYSYLYAMLTNGNDTNYVFMDDIYPGIRIKIYRNLYNNDGTINYEHTAQQTLFFKCIANNIYFKNADIYYNTNLTTLIPYQKYNFYIHYITKYGEITNGYLCNGTDSNVVETECKYIKQADKLVYPVFKNIKFPPGYVSCFFSIIHTENEVSTIHSVEISDKVTNNNNLIVIEGESLDINMMLLHYSNFMNVRYENNYTKAHYYDSNDSSKFRYFGANGVLNIEESDNIRDFIDKKLLFYNVQPYNKAVEEQIILTKCTPYIFEEGIYDNFNDLELKGYICKIPTFDRNRCINYYSDSNSIFRKLRSDMANNDEFTSDSAILEKYKLVELGKYKFNEESIPENETNSANNSALTCFNKNTDEVIIYSNYNLNFITISSNPKKVFKSLYYRKKVIVNEETSYHDDFVGTYIFKMLESLNLSLYYELPSMYRNLTNKQFYSFTFENKIKFDNTIRSSILFGDEEHIDIFKFEVDDYYNIPVDKGIITNIKAIGDKILVHTEHSMFSFSGSNNLQSSDGEIQQIESTPFDTGISEMFGSDFGFAGMQNKNDNIVTELGYIFFDRDAKIIYMYSGQGQIIKLTDSIAKLFNIGDIKDIKFANDYYNNRFFIYIQFVNGRFINLSFNILDNIKSFVSLHDFVFDRAFNTKTNCYFIKGNNIYKVDKTDYGNYTDLLVEDTDYLFPKIINTEDFTVELPNGNLIQGVKKPISESIIDVIENTNYEIIKTLDYIEWTNNFIITTFPFIGSVNIPGIDKNKDAYVKLSEELFNKIPYSKLLIYTDSCTSELIEYPKRDIIGNTIYNDDYKYPRYNQGKWTFNYFRDIENSNDQFKYISNNRYDDGRTNANYRSDNNSLIEGKYFVVRFFFNKEFKLETLSLQYKNKM